MGETNSALEDNVATAAPRATYQDVLDAPEHVVAEIINGTLYTHPASHTSPRNRRLTARHDTRGGSFDRGRGGPGGWRRDRMPQLPDTAYFELAPDWAFEVLSASTRKLDLVRKRPIYAHHATTTIR